MIPFFKRMQEARRPRCAALVPAAGSSSRMGGADKQLMELDGVPVLVRTLLALEQARRVDTIVVATREDQLVEVSRLCREYGITKCAKVVRDDFSTKRQKEQGFFTKPPYFAEDQALLNHGDSA